VVYLLLNYLTAKLRGIRIRARRLALGIKHEVHAKAVKVFRQHYQQVATPQPTQYHAFGIKSL